MKLLFYSDNCKYCIKLIKYIKKNNYNSLLLINIDNNDYPNEITIVPSLIDTELNQPLEGKKVFEYIINSKYFNNPTNNINNKSINPIIVEDNKANSLNNSLCFGNI